MLLGVNIDHVATLREARYALLPQSPNAEPSPLDAAYDAMEGGADSITIHVRGDRRHMQDRDAYEIAEKCRLPLNLEMGMTPKMLELALKVKPEFVCLVPESREEVTTEGGLDVAGRQAEVKHFVAELQAASIKVSLFIDPDLAQVAASADSGAEMVELHTGAFANAHGEAFEEEVLQLVESSKAAHLAGLQVNAGHGINYTNIYRLFAVPHLAELNIGHSIVSKAMRVGLREAVAEMRQIMNGYPSC